MSGATFQRLFVANRGEVAARIGRACDRMGIVPVFGVSEPDQHAPWTRGRECVVLGPARALESYLDGVRVVQAARQSGCTALHPGWGFLSEDAQFASLCEAHGVTFVGPPAHVIRAMGQKIAAKQSMRAAGVPVIPGSDSVLSGEVEAREVAEKVGYPVMLKAVAGGGGRGMRVVAGPSDLSAAYQDAQAEARGAFGNADLYLERIIRGGRHIEIQVFADRYGRAVHLGERDCTVQRNHQKLIEESGAPAVDREELDRAFHAAVRATASLGYVGAGTLEFLLDETGKLRFLEMNTRLQVEHSVTEMRTGVDLVVEQIRVAANRPLSFGQQDVELDGHVIECRINAEDPSAGFRPAPGTITAWRSAHDGASDVRIDTHVEAGYRVPPYYDSLLAKVLAKGPTRPAAAARLIEVLDGLQVEGIPTTIPMHLAILRSAAFRDGDYDTQRIPGWQATGSPG